MLTPGLRGNDCCLQVTGLVTVPYSAQLQAAAMQSHWAVSLTILPRLFHALTNPMLYPAQVTGLVTAPYNALLPNSSNAITVGSIDMADSLSAVYPSSVAVNGVACGLVVSNYSGER